MAQNTKEQKKARAIAAFLGTVVEYYDYSLYGFSAAILAAKFFPHEDASTSMMQVFAIYAVSYLTKPFGSFFFSIIGDSYGRAFALKLTIMGIGVPTLIIGLLPDYNSIGVMSTYVLVICRLLQGFFVGGEYDGAAIYIIEHLGKKNQYIASALTRSTGVIGLLLGIATTNFFKSSLFPDWAWRVPFVLSLPLAILTVYLRSSLYETQEFMDDNNKRTQAGGVVGLLSCVRNKWKILIQFIILSGGFGATYQICVIFMKEYLIISVPAAATIMSSFSVAIVFVFGLAMPVSGWLVDKFGIKILSYSLFSTIISCVLLAIAVHYQLLNLCLMSALFLSASISPFNALAHGVVVQALPVKERYRIIGLGHTVGSMLMSGTAGYICLAAMKYLKMQLFPIFYVAFFAVVAFFAFVSIFNNSSSLKGGEVL